MTIRETIYQLYADNLAIPVGDVDATTSFRNGAMDSLDQVELIMAVEDEYLIEISDDDSDGFNTLEDVIAYVAHRRPPMSDKY